MRLPMVELSKRDEAFFAGIGVGAIIGAVVCMIIKSW